MKIPKKVGTGMVVAGVLGAAASFGGTFYFAYKSITETSLEHAQVVEIAQQSSKLKDLVFECVPATYNTPLTNDCIDQKVQYLSLQQQKNKLMQSASYQQVKEKKEVYLAHSKGSFLGGLPLFGILYVLGSVVVNRREEEELVGGDKQ